MKSDEALNRKHIHPFFSLQYLKRAAGEFAYPETALRFLAGLPAGAANCVSSLWPQGPSCYYLIWQNLYCKTSMDKHRHDLKKDVKREKKALFGNEKTGDGKMMEAIVKWCALKRGKMALSLRGVERRSAK